MTEQEYNLMLRSMNEQSFDAWQLLIIPEENTSSLSFGEFESYDSNGLVMPSQLLFSRPAEEGVLGDVLLDNNASTMALFVGWDEVGLLALYGSPIPVRRLCLIGVPNDEAPIKGQAQLLRGGTYDGTTFTPILTVPLKVKNTLSDFSSVTQQWMFEEQGFSEIEPAQSDLEFMTPGGEGYLPFYVTTEHFPTPGFPTYDPQFARVQLHRLNDGKVVQTKWSDPVTGRGMFYNVDPAYAYAITATHPTHAYQALIASNIRPIVPAAY